MIRRLWRPILLAAVLATSVHATVAQAHPLGNFTVNHLTQVKVSSDRVDLRYILDQAEIPTFQARRTPERERLATVQAEVRRNLRLTVDGRPIPLEVRPGSTLELLPGQGGLKTTRIEVPLVGAVSAPRRVVLRDATFEGRLGWKAIVPRPGEGTDVRSSVSSRDVTNGLRSYPDAAPLDQRVAVLDVEPGDGALSAPGARGGGRVVTGAKASEGGFAGVLAAAASGEGVLLFLLLASFGWGALHALSPGHGKAMVAAYLVGSRGTSRDAVALGVVVTITHTIGVFAIGLVTLLLAQYILPENLYPWLNLVSGLLVVAIGGTILWSRLQVVRGRRRPALARALEHGHDHEHPGGHDHHHHHHHHHHGPREISWKGILGMGASAGLIPCPSALVVLLGAVSQQEVALGLLLIIAFSVGLAATLTALGVAVVNAGRLTSRANFSPGLTRALPAASALIIVAAGLVLTGRAVPGLV